jgi:hypothetical protein
MDDGAYGVVGSKTGENGTTRLINPLPSSSPAADPSKWWNAESGDPGAHPRGGP